jgi:hypothetical protein
VLIGHGKAASVAEPMGIGGEDREIAPYPIPVVTWQPTPESRGPTVGDRLHLTAHAHKRVHIRALKEQGRFSGWAARPQRAEKARIIAGAEQEQVIAGKEFDDPAGPITAEERSGHDIIGAGHHDVALHHTPNLCY